MLPRFLSVLGLVVVLAPVCGQSADEKKASVAFLQKLQSADGGFLPAPATGSTPQATPSLRATSAAIRALKYNGGAARDSKAAAAFVAKCFDKTSGGFADQPGGKPEVAVTAVGLMAVIALQMPVNDYAPAASKFLDTNAKNFEEIRIAVAGFEAIGKPAPSTDAWLKTVTQMRNADGSYGKGPGAARATGSAAAAVLRLGKDLDQRANVLKVLREGQRADGGWGKEDSADSDLETTYRVMRCFMMLKEKPTAADRLHAYLAKCRNPDGGCGAAPGQPSSVSGTYYVAIIRHWLDAK